MFKYNNKEKKIIIEEVIVLGIVIDFLEILCICKYLIGLLMICVFVCVY